MYSTIAGKYLTCFGVYTYGYFRILIKQRLEELIPPFFFIRAVEFELQRCFHDHARSKRHNC